jgi:hypothetical protein
MRYVSVVDILEFCSLLHFSDGMSSPWRLALLTHCMYCTPCVAAVCAALIANKAKEISRLNSVYNNLLRNAGVAYYEGKGSLLDKNTVQVGHKC